ncbi:MAG: hypothetical protein ACE5FS_11865 [Paracoccaceae bacterium]
MTALVAVVLAVLVTVAGAAPADAALPNRVSAPPPIHASPDFLLDQVDVISGYFDRIDSDEKDVIRLTDPFVDRLAKRIRAINGFCTQIPIHYRIDCLADQYGVIARSLPDGFEFRDLRDVLLRASRRLARISKCGERFSGKGADCDVDRTVPKISPKAVIGGRFFASSRRLKAIKPSRLADARKAAIAVVDETQTILLRSAENSKKRQNQYAKIAQAIDSNKVLLRS